MAIIKCKMCGGDLAVTAENTVAQCEYCGSRQTIPTADNEKKLPLFARANKLRFACEFDKASGVYETIVAEFPEEAEAYWGLVLCKYGIEYVDDPATGKKIPTCHRSSFDSIMDDGNFELVLECADSVARKVYREEAKAIEELRKGIIEVSGKEQPYDIFICYKETDENGQRTLDSVLAQDVYDALTAKGYRVFFSRITLEDKLGQEYEPYIFAALNSAKIMLAFGTDYEYYNAVWVKNEWSRFLQLMTKDKTKHLIPCYKDIDAYDMPKEFQRLQAQDLGKVGAVQDLMRGIEKLLPREEKKEAPAPMRQQVVASTGPNAQALIDRGNLCLEDGDWQKAVEFFDRALDMNAQCSEAYLGKALAAFRCKNLNALQYALSSDRKTVRPVTQSVGSPDAAAENALVRAHSLEGYTDTAALHRALGHDFTCPSTTQPWENAHKNVQTQLAANRDFVRARQYAAEETQQKLDAMVAAVEESYRKKLQESRQTDEKNAKAVLDGYRAMLANPIKLKALFADAQAKQEADYQQAKTLMADGNYDRAIRFLSKPIKNGYQDSAQLIKTCQGKMAQQAAASKKKKNVIVCVAAAVITVVLAAILLVTQVILPAIKYNDAVSLMNGGVYGKAQEYFQELGDYKDSPKMVLECQYRQAEFYLAAGNKYQATMEFSGIRVYSDARQRSLALWEEIAHRDTIAAGDYHTVGLKADGTLVAVGSNADGQCNVDSWTDIVAIAAGRNHTVGLKADGTAVAVGDNYYGQCDVSEWKDIVAIAAGSDHTVGLKADGTAVAVGYNGDGRCNVDRWTDIVAIAAGRYHTVGLKADGTAVAVGDNYYGQCDESEWKDIVAIAAGYDYTVALRADGTAVAVGRNGDGQCTVDRWTDIVAISAGYDYTVALKADGTVVAVGGNGDGQCEVSGWTNIKRPE